MGKNRKRAQTITAYAMLAPDIIGLVVFVFIPIIYAIAMSFFKWDGLTEPVLVGLDNYAKLLKNPGYLRSLKTTLLFTLMYVPGSYVVSLGLALLVNAIRGRSQQLFRTLFFMPYSVSFVVAGLAWIFILNPKRGILNGLITLLGGAPQGFYASTAQALPSVALVSVWIVLGYNMVLFLAALKDVPGELYEAADVDGAGSVRKFFTITVPMISNTSLFVVIVSTISSFQAFDVIRVMTNGGPAKATTVTVFYIYQQAFEVGKIGYSFACAVVLFLIIVVATMCQFALSNGGSENA